MSGLLWTRVRSGELRLDRELEQRLAREDLWTRARHRRLWAGLEKIGRRLADIGVEVAVIKGVVDEARWYERAGERPCVDLDLLVNPAQAHRVTEIVAFLDPDHGLRGSIEADFARGLLQSIDLEVGGLSVDLHLDLFKLGVACRQPDLLWEHTATYWSHPGQALRVLDAELALVNFLVHLNRNSFCWLLGFADVERLMRRESLDWELVAQLSRGQGIEVPVFAALGAVTEALGVPGSPLPSPSGARFWLWRALWRPSVRLQGDVGWIRFRRRLKWLPLLLTGRLSDALRWGWAQLLLSPELILHVSPGRGPWPWRLVAGRLGRAIQRRRAIVQLQRAESPDRHRDEAPIQEAG